MNDSSQKPDAISLFVYDSICISDDMAIEIVIIRVTTGSYPLFSVKEIAKLREMLHISIGNHVDKLTEDDLNEFGTSMLQVTAIVLKAKYLQTKVPLEV